jgi:hypothetical protein
MTNKSVIYFLQWCAICSKYQKWYWIRRVVKETFHVTASRARARTHTRTHTEERSLDTWRTQKHFNIPITSVDTASLQYSFSEHFVDYTFRDLASGIWVKQQWLWDRCFSVRLHKLGGKLDRTRHSYKSPNYVFIGRLMGLQSNQTR